MMSVSRVGAGSPVRARGTAGSRLCSKCSLENNPLDQFSVSNAGVQHTGAEMPPYYLLQLVSLSHAQVGSLTFPRQAKDVRRKLVNQPKRCCSFTACWRLNVQHDNIFPQPFRRFG
jgi:hypothetical protein